MVLPLPVEEDLFAASLAEAEVIVDPERARQLGLTVDAQRLAEALPMVTVITPTWHRHNMLFDRCIPSVRAQDYEGPIQHIIISDGPDPALAEMMAQNTGGASIQAQPSPARRRVKVTFDQLETHWDHQHWGGYCRNYAMAFAEGGLITYLDDDDAFRPCHIRLLANALLAKPECSWAYSQMVSHQPAGDVVIGDVDPPHYGQIGTPMIMHRNSMEVTWPDPSPMEDWNAVASWLEAGHRYVRVTEPTIDVWPNTFR